MMITFDVLRALQRLLKTSPVLSAFGTKGVLQKSILWIFVDNFDSRQTGILLSLYLNTKTLKKLGILENFGWFRFCPNFAFSVQEYKKHNIFLKVVQNMSGFLENIAFTFLLLIMTNKCIQKQPICEIV